MIERAHLRAFQIASRRAEEALKKGQIHQVRELRKQQDAIIELDETRREIFSRHDVSDVPILGEVDLDSTQDLRDIHGFSPRVANLLGRNNISTLTELEGWSDDRLLNLVGFGEKSLAEVRQLLEQARGFLNS